MPKMKRPPALVMHNCLDQFVISDTAANCLQQILENSKKPLPPAINPIRKRGRTRQKDSSDGIL